MKHLLQIHPSDNVGVAPETIPAGSVDGVLTFTATIPMGHKAALRDLQKGDVVCKYGFPIGRATAAIRAGEHVHSHNLASALGSDTALVYAPQPQPPEASTADIPVFQGFR